MQLDSNIRLALGESDWSMLSKRHEQLLNLRSTVDAEGSTAVFDVSFTNNKPFRVEIPFAGMPALFTEIRQAQALMLQRQRRRLDRGAEKLLELCATALRVIHLDTLIDPQNGDWLFIHQFEDHCPLAFRVSPAEGAMNLLQVQATLARLSH